MRECFKQHRAKCLTLTNCSLGTTGYIGGDAFQTIAKAHPNYEFTCLVRDSDKGAIVAAEYPKVRLVYGDLDSSDLIELESQNADIVCSGLLYMISSVQACTYHINRLGERRP